ncbi:hypothetical protein [Porphyromonas sp.]|uniref:hypothetical protein n=1 Tax=Porphyromonas sp. TaxID=1924944 RepID=UPI0026DC99DD|nr:hypothetical protein [Porphyromonas sp.]MDO4770747.1 hypothetical protein [Porphyromonas sp.]
MHNKIAILLTIILSISGCIDRDSLNGEVRLVAENPPSLVAPAVYASANLRDILIKSDEERASVLRVDEKGVLRLHKHFESVYRANLLDLVVPKQKEYRRQFVWQLPQTGQSAEVELPMQEGEIILNLPEKVASIARLTWACRVKMSTSDLPVHMGYVVEFPEIRDDNNQPLKIEWRTDQKSSALDKTFPQLSIEKKKGSALSLKYRVSARKLGTKRPGEGMPNRITVDLSLSEVDILKFEGQLSNTLEIKPPKPISFDYGEWDDLENLAIQGSSLELDVKYKGKMGFSTKADISLTNKKGKSLRVKPTLPLITLNALDGKGSQKIPFEAGVLDDILSGLSKSGISINAFSLDFSRSQIVLDKESFIDLSLILNIPLRMKFDRLPIKFEFTGPKIPLNEHIDEEHEGLLRNFAMGIDVSSRLPIGFRINELTMLDRFGKEIEQGRIPIAFDLKNSPDGIKAEESKLILGLSLDQVRRLEQAHRIRFSGEVKSSDSWVEFRPEQDIQFRIIILINSK